MATIKDLSSLQGRVAILTGATGGLGMAISDALAEMGANLILVDRVESDLVELARSLEAHWGCEASYFQCDLESQAERENFINLILAKYSSIDVLINNAAFVGESNLSGWNTAFEGQSIETWRRAIEVNLTAPFYLTQSLSPLLRASSHSNVVNIGSIYGKYGPDWSLYEGEEMGNPAAYAASKGGLLQLTRWLATTLAPEIRVNAISPGGIARKQPQKFVDRYKDKTPLKRMATEEDLKGAIAYLCTDLSAYVTGQCLDVDGGWGIW